MPENAASDRVLLYLHGGGFVTKSPAVHRIFVAKLAQGADVHAFVADYRLAPENPFPAALDDAETAYRGLLERGIPPNQITIAGDSAGGNLAAALLLKLRDSGQPLPACAALISALIDCTLPDADLAELEKYDPMLNRVQGKTWIQHYSQDHDLTDPLISPIFGDLSKLPPLLIHVGDHEILLSQTKRFAQKAQAAGVNTTLKVWEGMIHVFPLFAGFLPEGKTAIREISAFFRAHLN
ncbi:MAG: alpha/beta hydrolase [Chloroflexi bacterium]|nr:alpha/beta hydrolase [Chloroflexota bacterium]